MRHKICILQIDGEDQIFRIVKIRKLQKMSNQSCDFNNVVIFMFLSNKSLTTSNYQIEFSKFYVLEVCNFKTYDYSI